MDEESVAQPDRRVLSNFPFSIPHVIASVDLPNVDEIVRIMQEYTPHDSDPEPAQAPEPVEAPSEDPAWLGVMGPATELTIQEAIQNAGKTHGTEHDLPAILQTPVEVDSLKDGFEIGQLGSSLIDPALTAEPEAPTDTPAPQPVTMHASHRAKESLSPLPLLLVRPDGVGHGVGWSVLAYRTDSEGAPWGTSRVLVHTLTRRASSRPDFRDWPGTVGRVCIDLPSVGMSVTMMYVGYRRRLPTRAFPSERMISKIREPEANQLPVARRDSATAVLIPLTGSDFSSVNAGLPDAAEW